MRSDDQYLDERRAGVTLSIDPEELTLRETPFGMVVRLAGLNSGGEPGSPALPRTQVRIAVPAPYWPTELRVDDEQWITVVEAGALVTAAQPLRPGPPLPPGKRPGRRDAREDGDDGEGRADHEAREDHETGVHCALDCSCRTPKTVFRPPLVDGLPPPPVVPPDPAAYLRAIEDPPPPARAVRIEAIGTTHVAVIEVQPVRLTARGGFELCVAMRLSVEYAAEPRLADKEAAIANLRERFRRDVDPERVIPLPDPIITTRAEADRLLDLARDLVLNKEIVRPVDIDWPELHLLSEYLIVTDDRRWDAATITPGAAVPGMVAAFNRLAAAKRARGISTRVVTITDIVNGEHGDFRTGSLDLQEVIRSFLKHAKERWGVTWLLLGGDISIVPVRQVAGAMLGHVKLGTKASPDDNTSAWTGTQLRMKVVSLGDWWSASAMNTLVNASSGAAIPYDAAGTSNAMNPGWFFTAADWTTQSAVPTEYVVVNGPAALVNAELQFLYPWNTLPTDFYYASLANWVVGYQTVGIGWFSFEVPYVYVPAHDWDATDNGIYGQHREDGTDLDGVHLATDLSVGRAPVESAVEADTFVDKVLAYEAPGGGMWFSLDPDWPTRVVLASADWGGPTWFTSTVNATPGNGEYHHDAAAGHALLKKDGAPGSFEFDLIAHVSDFVRRVLPYKDTDDPSVRGWYYARSDSDLRVNEFTLLLPWGTIRIPLPSEWMVVHGSISDRTPAAFQLDWFGQDGSMEDQEALREQLRNELPAINQITRLYEDELDLTIAQRVAAPVRYLTSARLRAALDARPHVVSLSGHGTGDGCCGGSVAMASALTNGSQGFIAYADSCLTNQFDSEDAFSEALMTNPDGGAVAYVGNTRFSWVRVGDDFQRAFFHRLTTTRHLGLLNDSRVHVYGTTGYIHGSERWAILALNLLGDPELRVYRSPLPGIRIVIDPPFKEIDLVPVTPPWRRKGPIPDPPPLRGALVHVRAGEREWDLRPNADGRIRMPDDIPLSEPIEVTASHPDFVTTHQVLELAGSERQPPG